MPTYTITSDLGKDNYLTAIVKGAIYAQDAAAQIVEISSEVEAYNMHQTAYLFNSAYEYFPKGSYHFILSGLYNTNFHDLLIAQVNGHYLCFVDNGFASLLAQKNLQTYAIKLQDSFRYLVGDIAKVFAQACSFINKGVAPSEFCRPYELQFTPRDISAVLRNDEVVAQVLYIDRFKNVVVNITEKEFEQMRAGRAFTIEFIGKEKINKLSASYSDVEIGRKLCFFNNAGFLEIAVRGGAAAELFGFDLQAQLDDMYRTVKIYFE